MKVSRSGLSPQALATCCTSAGGGGLSASSTSVPLLAWSRSPSSSNSFSEEPMARAGPEPSTLYLLPLSSPVRLQPAYCEPRQASTGWLVCTVTTKGQALSVSVVSIATLPRPPRQISAMRRPASIPPTARTPQSIRHSPSVPRVTSMRKASVSSMRALTSGSTLALTLGQSVRRASMISSLLFTFFPPAQKTRQDFDNSLPNQTLGAPLGARAGPHSAYRPVFGDPFRGLRTVGDPIGPLQARRDGNADPRINYGGRLRI